MTASSLKMGRMIESSGRLPVGGRTDTGGGMGGALVAVGSSMSAKGRPVLV